ncbi:hypothetical protein IKG33_00975 [Candidatus Saccharibacteria bacterium]|nr:hypothetical protein [Candidatus Saccharibacteria bacterium]
MLKKFLIVLATVLTLGSFILSAPVLALNEKDGGGTRNPKEESTKETTADDYSGSCRYFLGMVSWDCNVNVTNQESLKSGIWTIAANVATDVTVAAAYLILGYIIYGGYLYIFSSGESGKVATGKKALYHAILGFAIVVSANVILTAIRFALGNRMYCDPNSGAHCIKMDDAGTVITSSLQWVIGIAGAIAAIFIVYGGISYITSRGEPNKLQQAKQMITYALIGLAIVALSEFIVIFVSNIINNANDNAYIKQTTISKEYHEKNIN